MKSEVQGAKQFLQSIKMRNEDAEIIPQNETLSEMDQFIPAYFILLKTFIMPLCKAGQQREQLVQSHPDDLGRNKGVFLIS